jgi:hypothetical protein
MIDLHCVSCGGDVLRRDAGTGTLVVCGTVQCHICHALPICINCRRPFAEHDARYHYVGARIPVGPFCTTCSAAIEIARVVCGQE